MKFTMIITDSSTDTSGTMVQDRGSRFRLGQSLQIDYSAPQRAGNTAKAVGYIAQFLNTLSMDQRVKNEIEKLKPEIRLKLIPNGGVLIRFVLVENIQFGYKGFHNVLILGSGLDYGLALRNALDQPAWETGFNSAHRAKHLYIWVTET